MAKCRNGKHDMQDDKRKKGPCKFDPMKGKKQAKITITTKCSNPDCTAHGIRFEWEDCK